MKLRFFLFIGVLVVGFVAAPFLVWGDDPLGASDLVLSADVGFVVLFLVVICFLALDIFLPVPSSLVAVSAGALLGFGVGALATAIGMTVGCIIGHQMGLFLASRRPLHTEGKSEYEAVEPLIERYGAPMLVVFRPIPVLAEASVFLAGVARMGIKDVLIWVTLSNIGIATAYAAVGAYAVRADAFMFAFLFATLVPALAYILARRWMRSGHGVK